jgi:hypothetical protein
MCQGSRVNHNYAIEILIRGVVSVQEVIELIQRKNASVNGVCR